MKIVLISYFGLADYTIALANALSKKNQVMLILAKKSAEPFINLINPAINCNLMEFPRLRNPKNLIFAIKIYQEILKFQPDVIHFQGGFIWFSFLLPWLKKWSIITTIHDDEPHSGDKESANVKWFLPNTLALLFSTKLIVLGKNIKKRLLAKYIISSEKIISILPGDGFLYKPIIKKENFQNRILFYGRILEYKGLPYLIRAVPLIIKAIPDIKICIAGDGNLLQKYVKFIENNDSFEIYNHYIDKNLTAQLFQKSALVVLPYNMATQSGVVAIAYTFSKPVIATNVGSLPEIVEHNKTGIIIPPRDEVKLAQAIIHLLNKEHYQ